MLRKWDTANAFFHEKWICGVGGRLCVGGGLREVKGYWQAVFRFRSHLVQSAQEINLFGAFISVFVLLQGFVDQFKFAFDVHHPCIEVAHG